MGDNFGIIICTNLSINPNLHKTGPQRNSCVVEIRTFGRKDLKFPPPKCIPTNQNDFSVTLSGIIAFIRINHFIQKFCPVQHPLAGQVYILSNFIRSNNFPPDEISAISFPDATLGDSHFSADRGKSESISY